MPFPPSPLEAAKGLHVRAPNSSRRAQPAIAAPILHAIAALG